MLAQLAVDCASASGSESDKQEGLSSQLGHQLSPTASIRTSPGESEFERWSAYGAPQPGVVVSVATEEDVARTIRYCVSNDIQFLAQNGGHRWAVTFNLDSNGLLIDIIHLNSVVFNANRTRVTLGGGVSIEEVVAAAIERDAQVATGNCNCVGALGAILGGGYGNLLGLVGLGVDNILSMNVVLADGQVHTVTPEDDNGSLFWALRGAGPNFGIVTSAVLKSYPVASAANVTAWMGRLVLSGEQVEAVVAVVDSLILTPEMNIFLYFTTESNGTQQLLATPFFYGYESEARRAFEPLLDIGPLDDATAEVPYARWNEGSDGFCSGGGYKPAYSAALNRLLAGTWKEVWDEYVSFTSRDETRSSFIMEAYSLHRAQSLRDDSSAFPWRNGVNFHAIAMPWYSDAGLERCDGVGYINFGHGDENLTTIYGGNVERLRAIKTRVDHDVVFSTSGSALVSAICR
ncbi:hypothetical protein BDV06DRAFT_211158 [Aspergillus oleicola]